MGYRNFSPVVYKVIITGFVSNVYFCHDASIFVDVSTFVNDVITTEMNRKVIDSLQVKGGQKGCHFLPKDFELTLHLLHTT